MEIEKVAAIVLAHGALRTSDGKVAHGLIRGSDRFSIQAVVDPDTAGSDAGEVLDGRQRGIPVVASLAEALAQSRQRTSHCIIGVATLGGRITPALRAPIREAIEAGLSIVNGLHDWLKEDADLAKLARQKGVELIDLRCPPPRRELHFWSGEIYQVRARRIAVLGTDCALGKRTTTRLLLAELNARSCKTEMIYTGQTGWMQGARYGLVFDSLPNDFVCGELEHAIVRCAREVDPDIVLIEGQSALRNPCGPCGGEMLLAAAAHGVVLQHAPGRKFYEDFEHLERRIPPLEDEIELISRYYGVPVLGVSLNGQGLSEEQLIAVQQELQTKLSIPVVRPLEEGVAELAAAIVGAGKET